MWGTSIILHSAQIWAGSSHFPHFGSSKALAKLAWLFLLLLGILVFSEYCVVFASIYQPLFPPWLLSVDWTPTIFWVFSQRLLIPDLFILFWTVFILSLFSRPFLLVKMNLEYNPSFQLCLQFSVTVHDFVPSGSSMTTVNSTKLCFHQLDATFHFERKHMKNLGQNTQFPPSRVPGSCFPSVAHHRKDNFCWKLLWFVTSVYALTERKWTQIEGQKKFVFAQWAKPIIMGAASVKHESCFI